MGTFAMTGGATGIGAAVREQLGAAGHQVIVVDIKNADIIADLSTAEGRQAAIAGIREKAPDGLDGFVPCAGVGPSVSPPSLVTRINYFGTTVLVEALKPLVAKKKGCMVLLSSNSAPMGCDADYVEKCLSGDEDAATARCQPTPGKSGMKYKGTGC